MTPWHERGACRGNTDAEFFPTLHTPVAKIDAAYALCASCPLDVRAKCEESAEGWGIWNGINRQPSVEYTLRGKAARKAITAVEKAIESTTITSRPDPTTPGASLAVTLLGMGDGGALIMRATDRDARSMQQSARRYLDQVGDRSLRMRRRELGDGEHEFSLAVK